MKVIAVIPARGGSKGVINKNIRLIDGEPLISYAIETAKQSKLLTDFVVSSEDETILNIAKTYNAPCHKRNEENAEDHSPIESVIEEVLQFLKKEYDLIVLLQPTAPIRTGKDVDNVIKMFLEDENLENVISVIELDDIHPARMYQIDTAFNLKPLNSNQEKKQRQSLNSVYLRNGCIYAITTKAFLEHQTLILKNKKAYIMPYSNWANIDSERDLIIAECLIKLWKEKQ